MSKETAFWLRIATVGLLACSAWLLPVDARADAPADERAAPRLRMQQSLAAPDADPAAADADRSPLTRIGIGDTVSMQVYGKPDLAATGEIAEDGSFLVPLAGPVHIAGLSPTQAAARISDAYEKGQYLVSPQVAISVKETRSQRVSVLGEVFKPGRYPVSSNTSIFDLLALAGGASTDSASVIYLIRKDADGRSVRTEIDLSQMLSENPVLPEVGLTGGDTIYVPRQVRHSCFVLGEVNAPGQVQVDAGMTVLQAIAKAGGISRRGSSSRIEIKRKGADGSFRTQSAKQSDKVQADDLITVKESIF